MVRIEDCKKGMHLSNGVKSWKILKVGKTSVTVDREVNWGTGMMAYQNKGHKWVVRLSQINKYGYTVE